ncbi:MAG: Dihydrolipoyllysine-residue acetyltransferase component of pyruvate dehydrogenase complex [Ignavibacteria bacterium]|nr:Dihydrolipoyllysine-residue acetyltransferase component of pyruvate dehydrogenase complex [Ignavibacteria bacterium]
MIKEIKLPEVSDNVESGDVVKILVKIGDKISIDQPLIELETEKAMFEVPSTEAGIVKEIKVKEGEAINIGDVIIKIETDDAPVSEIHDIKIENSKKQETSSPVQSNIKESLPESVITQKTELPKTKEAELTEPLRDSAPASPSVRKLARELGVDVGNIKGSGLAGRITDEDVKQFVKMQMSVSPVQKSIYVQKPLPDFKKWGDIKIEPMSKVRILTAESMSAAWSGIPMVTQFDKADVSLIEETRKNYSKKIEEAGGKLTFTSILVKICSAALLKFPNFNSSIDTAKNEIIYKNYVNVGIAVDSERGLLVPVIKNSDKKNITEISVELSTLSEKVRNKKITPDEMDGGNFTISNLGGIGGTGFTPIVYPPQVAILGVSRSSVEPVYINEKFEPRLILPLTLTYDHRIIDGAEAARLLRWICETLENPILINM